MEPTVTTIRNSTVIHCTPELAFDYLSDMRNELEWNPAVESVEKLTEGPIGIGTRYRAKWKGGPPVEVTVIAFDRPDTWQTHNDGPMEVAFKARLEPDARGSRLSVEFDAQPHGWFRLIFPIILRRLRRDEKANMTYIHKALEP
jgi:hypothetical protein